MALNRKKYPIQWNKLEKNKDRIKAYKEEYGTESAIRYCEGYLGLQHGEYGKNEPRIRKFVKTL